MEDSAARVKLPLERPTSKLNFRENEKKKLI